MQPQLMITEAPLTGADLTLADDGRTVVHGVGIDPRAGTVVALIGPNGLGRSALLRSLAQPHTPRSGGVVLVGEDAFALRRRDFARRVTRLTHSRPTPDGMSARAAVTKTTPAAVGEMRGSMALRFHRRHAVVYVGATGCGSFTAVSSVRAGQRMTTTATAAAARKAAW